MPEEAEALRTLRSQGILVEAWSPGVPGAVLIIQASSEAEGEDIVAQLPLRAAGLIEIDLTPLYELEI